MPGAATSTTPGTDSPFRNRTPAENLERFREMQSGRMPDGAAVLRAKIDMASPNINLRDPALYRIKHATHHNTGDTWCIYPMYAYAHPIEDALENITHSICTLEFEDQRPWYDWLLDKLADLGLLQRPAPRQHEFGRLNLTYVITSKRKLKALVDEGIVDGWDDPRMPTLFGMRRRGYTPESIRAMADGTGASKTNIWLDYSVLEGCLRDDLEGKAPRAMAVIDPLPLKLTNWADVFGAGHIEACHAPAHPQRPELGQRSFGLGPALWIERDDFAEVPAKGFFRLFPGNKVRLKYGLVVECTGCEKDDAGNVTAVLATVVPDTRSGTPGADAVKVKGTITWVGQHDAVPATIQLYDRLFTEPQPDAGGRDFREALNPHSKRVVQGYVEPALASAPADQRFQFERHGYFVTDRKLTTGPKRRCSTASPPSRTAGASEPWPTSHHDEIHCRPGAGPGVPTLPCAPTQADHQQDQRQQRLPAPADGIASVHASALCSELAKAGCASCTVLSQR